MSISQYFFVAVLVIATINLTNLKAMPHCFEIENESITLDDLKITSGMLFQAYALLHLEEEILLDRDVSKIILKDLFYVHMILKLSSYLKANQKDPAAVLKMVNQLFKQYGHDVSVNVLSLALDHATMWIGDIKNHNEKRNCFTYCEDPNCLKIILCVTGSRAFELISKADLGSGGWAQWHNAVSNNSYEIFNICTNWAIETKNVQNLFFLKLSFSRRTVFHIAASDCSHLKILKQLLEIADTIPGLVVKLLVDGDRVGDIVFNMAKNNPQVFEVIKPYIEKYQLADL